MGYIRGLLTKFFPAFLLFIGVLLVFWKPLFHSDFTLLSGNDMCSQTYPWFQAAAFWLKKGKLLLWDPYVFSGRSNLGEVQSGILYPLNWIFMLRPSADHAMNPYAIQDLIIMNYCLIGYFSYLLGKSLGMSQPGAVASAICFTMGGFLSQVFGFLNIFSGFVWFPLIFLLIRRAMLSSTFVVRLRWSLWCGLLLTLSFLAGHHAAAFQSMLLAGFYAIFLILYRQKTYASKTVPRVSVCLLFVILSAALLSAIQWIPAFEWARLSYRWVGAPKPVGWGESIPYSVLQNVAISSPQDVLSLLVTRFETGLDVYTGPISLFLALVGFLFVRSKEARFFSFAIFVYLFLSWGRFSSIHGWINTFVPKFWFAREAYFFLIPLQLCVAMLAGFGLDHLIGAYTSKMSSTLRKFIPKIGWVLAFTVVASGLLVAFLVGGKGVPMNNGPVVGISILMVFVVILGSLLFFLHTKRITTVSFAVLIILAMFTDLTSHFSGKIEQTGRGRNQDNPTVDQFWDKPWAAAPLLTLREKEIFRVGDPLEILPPNFGDVWRLDGTSGYGATQLASYYRFQGAGWSPMSNASALLNVRYFMSPVAIPEMKLVARSGEFLYFNPRGVSRAFLVSRYRTFSDKEDVLTWISTPLFSPAEDLILAKEDTSSLEASFLQSLSDESQDVFVQQTNYHSPDLDAAKQMTDKAAQSLITLFHPPWGWGRGDNLQIAFGVPSNTEHCYLILNYYPANSDSSQLTIRLASGSGSGETTINLERKTESDTGGLHKAAVDLGNLSGGEYQLTITKVQECEARIDSVGLSRFVDATKFDHPGSLEITAYEPNRIELSANLAKPAFVVLSEIYYPGWKATVDGNDVALLRADSVLRAIPVREGKHRIELAYRPGSLIWGSLISLVSLACVAVFLIRFRKATEPDLPSDNTNEAKAA